MRKTLVQESVEEAKALSPLFRDIDFSGTDSRILTFDKGQTLDGVSRTAVILVCAGQVQVMSNSRGKKEVILSTLRRGDVFGINSLYLEDEDTGTTLRCGTAAILFLVSRMEYRKLLEADPQAMASYARYCNQKIHFLLGRIEELTGDNTREIVFNYLQTHADPDGNVSFGRSKEALAKVLNISRAALFAQLAAFEQEGLTEKKDGKVRLKDKAGLEDQMNNGTDATGVKEDN